MTRSALEHQLTDLLREAVSDVQAPLGLPERARAGGRQRMRRRGLGGATAAVALASGVTATVLGAAASPTPVTGFTAATPSTASTTPAASGAPSSPDAAAEDLSAVRDRLLALADGRALPLWKYSFGSATDDDVMTAYNDLVDRCLRSHGVTPVEPRPQPPTPTHFPWLLVPDPFLGYHDAPDPAFVAYQAADDAWTRRHPLPPDGDYQQVLTGTRDGSGSGGCQGTAWRQLDGTGEPLVIRSPEKSLEESTWDATPKDPVFRAAEAQWSRCMTAAGHPASDPWVLSGSVRDGTLPGVPFDGATPGGRPSAAELALARVDLRCADESRLWDIFFPLLYSRQSAAIEAHRDSLAPALARMERVRKAARAYLARRGTPVTAGTVR